LILREKREVASHTTLQIPLPNQNPLVGTVAPRFRNKLSWQPLGSRSVLAESAIDALSHAALFPDAEDQTRYASLGGKPSSRQTGLVQATIARLPEGAEIVAAFDADEVGRKLVDGRELFRISQNNIVRVFVTVPEEFSKQVRPGTKASMDLTELPNRRFTASVTRTTDAIDVNSRTLTVELDVPNPSGELLPGAYANVHFQLPLKVAPLVLPSSTILFQADGPQVGVVNARNQVELRKVTLGHDFGDTIQVLNGVRPADAVIANPPDSLTNGMRVAAQPASENKTGN
jgi:multidrug efflux pump subunit AcrA (membrane-fusion protein)